VKILLKYLGVYVGAALFLYLTVAFINSDMVPGNWEMRWRVLVASLSFIAVLFSLTLNYLNKGSIDF
jgi:hypothetical protein